MLHAAGPADLLAGRPRPGRRVLRTRRGRSDERRRRPRSSPSPGRAGHRRHRARRLARGRRALRPGAGAHGGRQLRRLLDQRARLRVGRPRRVPQRRPGRARDLAAARRTTPTAAHPRAPRSCRSRRSLELAHAYIASATRRCPCRLAAGSPTSISAGPGSATSPRRPPSCCCQLDLLKGEMLGVVVAHHGGAADCCRSCRRTSRWSRSASGCSCRATRSSRRRSPSTASSVCRVGARRSPACTSSGLVAQP